MGEDQPTAGEIKQRTVFLKGCGESRTVRDNLKKKYVIEKSNATPGEIASPFPVWGNLHYPCIG